MSEPKWKQKFIERYSKLTDIEPFLATSLKPMRKSVRVNTLKISVEELKKKFKLPLMQIPWCKEGFWTEGYAVGNSIEHFLGYIYIQGAASMIPPVVLGARKDEVVLDICASPGSKTSQIAAMMENKGLVIANDIDSSRLKPLSCNLERCGVSNTVLTMMEGRWFKNSGIMFDRILVDAPCSGIGTIRKSFKTIEMWNPDYSRRMAGIQRQLLSTAFGILKEDGTIVYSTCTLEPEENEGVIDWLLQNCPDAKLEKIELDIKHGKAVEEFEGKTYSPEVKKCLRIWPQDNDTEGFFVTKIRKVK